MTINQFFIIVATVLFTIACLVALDVVTSDDGDVWVTAGLACFAAGHIQFPGRQA